MRVVNQISFEARDDADALKLAAETLPITRNIQKIRTFLGSSNAMSDDAAHCAICIERHLLDGYRAVCA